MIHTRLRLFACMAVVGLVCVPAFASAAEFRNGDQPTLTVGETLTNDLYIAGGNVTSAGSVTGDLIGAGGSVIVTGPVSSDVMVSGGTITLLGEIGDDVRAAGGNILIQGAVHGDVVVAGGQLNIAGPGIGGDVIAGGGVIRIDAPVAGNVRIGGGQVVINAPIMGNVQIQAEKVTLGSKADIQGSLTYRAIHAATIEDGALVHGETQYEERPDVRGAARAGFVAFASLLVVVKFLMLLCGALVIGLGFRAYSLKLVQVATAQPLGELGRGAIFSFILPVVSILLLCTVVGLPLGFIGLLAFTGMSIAAWLAAPLVVGSVLYRSMMKGKSYEISWKTILLGTAIYFLITLIPFVGGLVAYGIMLLTLGAAIKIKSASIKQWR